MELGEKGRHRAFGDILNILCSCDGGIYYRSLVRNTGHLGWNRIGRLFSGIPHLHSRASSPNAAKQRQRISMNCGIPRIPGT